MLHVNHHRGCCGTNPTRPDGTEWPHVLILHSGADVRADTPAEVIGELIPGYRDLDEAGRLAARTQHAETMAAGLQQVLTRRAEADDPGVLAVLTAPKSSPIAIRDPERPGAEPRWDVPVPLVLVTTTYAPHTDAARIGGNVVWVDPVDEQGFLDSLGAARIYDYWRDPAATS